MKSRLRILYVLPYTPSPIRVRPYQIIRSLVKQGHQVTIAALEDSFATRDVVTELREICTAVHIVPHPKGMAALNCLLSLPTATPLWAAYCQSPRMVALLQNLVRQGQFDIAHVEHLRAAHFASALDGLPKILDAVDCITALRRQMLDQGANGLSWLLNYEEWWKMQRYEPQIYKSYRRIVVTSPYDASALATLDPAHLPPIDVIPNGVDLEFFHPQTDCQRQPDTIVFSGKMSYIANEDAATFLLKEVLPHIRKQRPEVKVLIVGSSPSAKLKTLAERCGGVTVTGFVEDIRPFLSKATVAICPMRIGVGIQNKVLEAMAMGCPVVVTPLAGRALTDAKQQSGIRIAQTAEALADACVDFLMHPADAKQSGIASRQYVEGNHCWETMAELFVDIYRREI